MNHPIWFLTPVTMRDGRHTVSRLLWLTTDTLYGCVGWKLALQHSGRV